MAEDQKPASAGTITTDDAAVIRYAVKFTLLMLADGLGSGSPLNKGARDIVADMKRAGDSALAGLSGGPGMAVLSGPDLMFMQMAVSNLLEQTAEKLATLKPKELSQPMAVQARTIVIDARRTLDKLQAFTGDRSALPDVTDADVLEFTQPD